MSNYIYKECNFCQKSYKCHKSYSERSKYCSRICLGKSTPKRSNNEIIQCGFCHKEMKLPKSRKKQTSLGIICCSRECKGKLMKSGNAGYGFKKIEKERNHGKYYAYKVIVVNGKRVKEHRWIVEKHIGRKLKKDEFVHHINGNSHDNRIENLMIVDNRSHGKIEFSNCDRLYK